MSRVICPNCKTEFEIGKENGWVQGDPMPNSNEVVGTLIPAEKKENNIMKNNNSNNTTNNNANGGFNMNGMNMDMDMLAKMVAQMINSESSKSAETKETNVQNKIVNQKKQNIVESTVEGGKWAKTSKYYGKEICGYVYNPYLDRRFLPSQFIKLMNDYNRNVDDGIRHTVSYMDAIYYMIDEIEKLNKLNRKDYIAYQERKQFWTKEMCRNIFVKYLEDCLDYIGYLKRTKNGKTISIPGIGHFNITKETVPNMKTKQFEEVITINGNIEDKIRFAIDDFKNLNLKWGDYSKMINLAKSMPKVKIPSVYKLKLTFDYSSRNWNKKFVYYSHGYNLPKDFVEGYKKSGAYYTLKDKIKFEECGFKGYYGREAVAELRCYLDDGAMAYEFYAMLKEIM